MESSERLHKLQRMLTYTRRHDTQGEHAFIDTFIKPLIPETFVDDKGEVLAYVVEVRDSEEGSPPYLFCCHTDTVHDRTANPVQQVMVDDTCGLAYKDDGQPLGADDAAGVWLLINMIEEGVPGTYIFHRGEECGGIGSRGMVAHHAQWLSTFTHAIAFDRKGTTSVITEQYIGETASLTFAQALSDLLNDNTSFEYAPDETGIFTDTANYAHLIPECTNVSVGYYEEHTKNEYLDMWHLDALLDQLVYVFRDTNVGLPVVRIAEEPKSKWGVGFQFDDGKWGNGRVNGLHGGSFDPTDPDSMPANAREVLTMRYSELTKWVRAAHPEDVADLLVYLAEEAEYVKVS
jgi:hypothetical protein